MNANKCLRFATAHKQMKSNNNYALLKLRNKNDFSNFLNALKQIYNLLLQKYLVKIEIFCLRKNQRKKSQVRFDF